MLKILFLLVKNTNKGKNPHLRKNNVIGCFFMRNIKFIVLHCTATSQNASVQSIQKYWKEQLKWKSPGYHFLFEKDGTIHNLLKIEEISNGVAGYNSESIHISYIGGIDDKNKGLDNRTPKQILSQLKLIIELKKRFSKAEILGHRDFPNVKKECPSFDTKKWLMAVGFVKYPITADNCSRFLQMAYNYMLADSKNLTL